MLSKWIAYGLWRHPEKQWEIWLNLYLELYNVKKVRFSPKQIQVSKDKIYYRVRRQGKLYSVSKHLIIGALHPGEN